MAIQTVVAVAISSDTYLAAAYLYVINSYNTLLQKAFTANKQNTDSVQPRSYKSTTYLSESNENRIVLL